MSIPEKPLSLLAKRMFPTHVVEDHPQIVTFMQKVFAYMDQQGNQYDALSNLLAYTDVDTTLPQFEEAFKAQYLKNFPDALAADVDLLVKNIRSFYLNKGTEQSFRFLFGALYDSTVNFKYPKFNILRASDGQWFTPQFLVLEDDSGNRPPQLAGGADYKVEKLIDKFITGTTTGAVAFVEDAVDLNEQGLFYSGIDTLTAIQIVEKEGDFIPGEQILIGDTLIQNGDFSSGLSSWQTSNPNDSGSTTYVSNGQLIISQPVGDVNNRFIYQAIEVESSVAYYFRYSLVSANSGETRVTIGLAPGTNELYDTGALGTSALTSTVDIGLTPQGTSTIYVSIHNNMTTAGDAAIYDGISLVRKDTSNTPLLFIAQQGSFDYLGGVSFDGTQNVATAWSHDFTDFIDVGDSITISGSTSNDGVYTIDQLLSAFLSTGDTFTVSGSGSNDGTYTVLSATSTTITVAATDTLANEAPGATVFITAHGITQSYNDLTFADNGLNEDTITTAGSNNPVASYIGTSGSFTTELGSTPTITKAESGIIDGAAQYKDTRGFLSQGNSGADDEMVLRDGDFYQDYSYQVKSQVDVSTFESIVKDLVHPAGFKLFADVIPPDDLSTISFRYYHYTDLDIDTVASGNDYTITAGGTGRAFDEAFRVGDLITITGTLNNDGFYRVQDTPDSTTLVLKPWANLTTENLSSPPVRVTIQAGIGVLSDAETNLNEPLALSLETVFDVASEHNRQQYVSRTLSFDTTGNTITEGSTLEYDFTDFFQNGDTIQISDARFNNGSYLIDNVTASVLTISGTTPLVQTTAPVEGFNVKIELDPYLSNNWNGLLPVTQEYDLEYINTYGFGRTWAYYEANREVLGITIEEWESLIIGDFDSKATSRFGFIDQSEVTIGVDYTGLSFNNANPDTITKAGGWSFVDTSSVGEPWIQAGDLISIDGSTLNDGVYLVQSVTANTITLDAGASLTADTAESATITSLRLV